ncbi:MAG: hypothetical protein RR922_06700 [Clostridia bacterium]
MNIKIDNYIAHANLVVKSLETIKNDYSYIINEGEITVIEGYISNLNKFISQITPYYEKKAITKVEKKIIEKNVNKILDIEEICKKYTIKTWKEILTLPKNFSEGHVFDFLVYSFDFDLDNFNEKLKKFDNIELNYITEKNLGVSHRNYGLIFSIEEEDLISASMENIYFELQESKNTFFINLKSKSNLYRRKVENFLMFHDVSSSLITPKQLKQKVIEKEVSNHKALLSINGMKEYVTSIIANAKTLEPLSFFVIIDDQNDYTELINKLNANAESYKIPLVIINRTVYQKRLQDVYK